MSWVKIDDSHPDHPKIMALGPLRREAGFLNLEALCYSARLLTDGRLPAGVVKGYPRRLVAALVRVGLWEQLGDGDVLIHDYLVYQPSRATILAQRETTRLRVAGLRRNAGSTRVQPAVVTPAVTPLPSRPLPTQRESAGALSLDRERMGLPSLDERAVKALVDRTGQPWSLAGDKQLGEYDRLVGIHGLTAVLEAWDAIAGGRRLTARQVIWTVMKRLEPMADGKAVEKAHDDAKRAARRDQGVWQRRVERYQNTGEWEPEWGDKPGAVA